MAGRLGHHGYLHAPPPQLTEEEERTMIERGLETLERVTGRRPGGYRSPARELSKATFRLLGDYGFEYDASQLRRSPALDRRRRHTDRPRGDPFGLGAH